MQRKPTSAGGRRAPGLKEAKWLIVTMSMTLVLALWSIFSRPAADDSASAAVNIPVPEQQVAEMTLDLPPLPTLIAPLPTSSAPTTIQQAMPVQERISQPAIKAPPTKIILGGKPPSKPGKSSSSSSSAPVTSTSSSR
jgi:hypothetical protein